ncbi:MAG: phosphatase PAP2 family protein [Bacteroidales bacterium]
MTISPTIDYDLMLSLNGDLGAFMDNFMWCSSSKLATVPLSLFALIVITRRYGWKQLLISAVIIGLMILVADQTCNFFKDNVSRLRPTRTPELEGLLHTVNGYMGGTYGTVSAHAANSIAVLGFCALVVSNQIYTLLTVLTCIAICYSRIYLGVHFPLDIMWGTILGCTIAYIAYRIFKSFTPKAN